MDDTYQQFLRVFLVQNNFYSDYTFKNKYLTQIITLLLLLLFLLGPWLAVLRAISRSVLRDHSWKNSRDHMEY